MLSIINSKIAPCTSFSKTLEHIVSKDIEWYLLISCLLSFLCIGTKLLFFQSSGKVQKFTLLQNKISGFMIDEKLSFNILQRHVHGLYLELKIGLLLIFCHSWNKYHLIYYFCNMEALTEECYRLILAGIAG